MRRFAGVDINGVPDETTICKFRHFLEAHGLTEALFEQAKRYLSQQGLIVSEGTIVDACLPSTCLLNGIGAASQCSYCQ